MRVVVLTTSYPLSPSSHSGIFVKRLVDHLPAHVTPLVLTPCARGHDRRAIHSAGVHCFRYAPKSMQRLAHGPGGIPAALRSAPWLYLILPLLLLAAFFASWRMAKHADVLHGNWSINGVIAGLAARLRGKVAVVTLRGSDVSRAERSRLDRWLLRLCVRLNSKLVTVSHALRTGVERMAPEAANKVEVIPNGVDDVFFAINRDRMRGAETIKLMCIGNLIPDKGVDVIVRALSAVPAAHLSIIGAGSEHEKLTRLARDLAIKERVHFTGALPPADIASRLAMTDVYISASYHEGRSNALLEAMASGCAVVVTRIPGIDELVQHEKTGLVFDAGDVDALKELLQRLAADADLRLSLGQAARTFARAEGWRWSDTAARYAAVYAEALQAPAR